MALEGTFDFSDIINTFEFPPTLLNMAWHSLLSIAAIMNLGSDFVMIRIQGHLDSCAYQASKAQTVHSKASGLNFS